MESRSASLNPGHPPEVLAGDPPTPAAAHRMSTRKRMLFFLTAWLIVLMPFLFWWSTWFGRHLTDQQITEYLNDAKHPRHIQHALVQLGERMGRHDAGAARWYPDLVRLASYPVEEVRNTDAWVMGQDTSDVAFHKTLLTMLGDSSLLVRGNAALSLVRFGDASGRAQIVALLQPAVITAPSAGVVSDTDKIGTPIHQGGVIAKLQDDQQTIEVRSPISGRIRTLNAQKGANVTQGFEIATVAPGDEQVWEALRALYLIGQLDDLPAILPYERELPEIPDRVRQQALLTEKAIRDRAAQHSPHSSPSPASESEKNPTL
jgi:Biotin-requiring enzyme